MASSPTSILSSTDNKKSGLDLKNEGNAYFTKRQFDEALARYSEGIKVVAHDDDDLEATLYSNISSCYFEMGDYATVGLPDSVKRVGNASAFPNEYPGQNYEFYWALNFDSVTPLKESAFCINKPLGVKIAGLAPLPNSPLTPDNKRSKIYLFIKYEKNTIENSATYARKCSQLLMESMAIKIKAAVERGESGKHFKLPPLAWKNTYRMARALHFGNSPDAEVNCALHTIEKTEESGEYGSMAAKMREQLDYYQHMPSNNKAFEPSLLRASFQNPYVEYYNFGHDESESLLQRNEGSKAQSILLDDLDDEELSSLSFLFGGVGDGRHAFVTLLDANHQYQSLSKAKQDKFCLHMTLNDISAQLLAKDALVLVLAHELSRVADSVVTALTTADPFNIGLVIYYATLGYVMPPFVYRKMVEHIKRWFTDNTLENFLQTFPWLVLSDDTWEGIVWVMNSWVDPETQYSPNFPSVTEILSAYRPTTGNRADNAMAGLSSIGAGSEMMGDIKAKFDSSMEKRRAEIVEITKSIDLEPEMISLAKHALGGDASEEQMRKFLADMMMDKMMEGGPRGGLEASFFVSNLDKLFIEQTKCLNPQFGPSDEMREELSYFVLGENGSSKEETIEAINKYKSHIREEWVTNPVQIDPSYWCYTNGNKATDEFNPVKEFPEAFMTPEVISFMSEPPPDILSAKTDEEKKKVIYNNTLAFNLIRYYWHVGRAVADLSSTTTIEIALGSIIAFGDTASEREGNGLPTKYHRITLSNIPDYTGMHSVFVKIAPLLSLKSKSVTPCIQSNCLLNTGLWKSFDDYIFSTTALGYKEAEAVFRLRVVDEEESIWGTGAVWEQGSDDDEHIGSLPLSHEELRSWLHRLFLSTILPPDRDVNSGIREERASNVNLFLQTLSHCINHLGMPAHFIASILEDLLKKKTLVTKATLSNESPAPYLGSKNVYKKIFVLSAFQTDLANQTAIFLQSNMLGFRLLDTSFLPTQKASLYELKLSGISSKYDASWAYEYGRAASAMALGFMLQKKKGSGEYGIGTAASNGSNNFPMFMMMQMMQGQGCGMPEGQKNPSKLRRDLLSTGDEVGHVFSCMNWNLANQTASFWMCEDVFEKFSAYHFRLIRTDGWFCLPHCEATLGDAKRID